MRMKYPRTPHFTFSPGTTNDDKVLKSVARFAGREVVITEKMDGENSTLAADYIHARSMDSRNHESRDWLKRFHGDISYMIPIHLRICGENLYAKHSIAYDDLLSYFYGFSVWTDSLCHSWDYTLEVFQTLRIVPVREIYRGPFDLKYIINLAVNIDINKQEGFVVRLTDEFYIEEFGTCVAKWVRPGHVQTDDHWMTKEIIPNKLKA